MKHRPMHLEGLNPEGENETLNIDHQVEERRNQEHNLAEHLDKYHNRFSRAWFNKTGVAKEMLEDPDGYFSTLPVLKRGYAIKERAGSLVSVLRTREGQVNRNIGKATQYRRLIDNCDRMTQTIEAEKERHEQKAKMYQMMLEDRNLPARVWDRTRGKWGMRHLMAAGDWMAGTDFFRSYSGQMVSTKKQSVRLGKTNEYVDQMKEKYNTKLEPFAESLDAEKDKQSTAIDIYNEGIDSQLEILFETLEGNEQVEVNDEFKTRVKNLLLYPGVAQEITINGTDHSFTQWRELLNSLRGHMPDYIYHRLSRLKNLGKLAGRKINQAKIRKERVEHAEPENIYDRENADRVLRVTFEHLQNLNGEEVILEPTGNLGSIEPANLQNPYRVTENDNEIVLENDTPEQTIKIQNTSTPNLTIGETNYTGVQAKKILENLPRIDTVKGKINQNLRSLSGYVRRSVKLEPFAGGDFSNIDVRGVNSETTWQVSVDEERNEHKLTANIGGENYTIHIPQTVYSNDMLHLHGSSVNRYIPLENFRFNFQST